MTGPLDSIAQDGRSAGAADVKWYAGMAMQAMIAERGIPEAESAREEIALWSFRMGQAMVVMDHRLHVSG